MGDKLPDRTNEWKKQQEALRKTNGSKFIPTPTPPKPKEEKKAPE